MFDLLGDTIIMDDLYYLLDILQGIYLLKGFNAKKLYNMKELLFHFSRNV